MKFIVSSTALSSHLQAISRVINSKNALPILDCFLFELEDGTLSVTVSDSETTMVTTVEVNESDTNGRFAVVAKTLLDALKEIPEQPLTFDINPDNYEITVQYQNGKYSLMGQNADEFPQSATLGDNAVRVEMEASVLAPVLQWLPVLPFLLQLHRLCRNLLRAMPKTICHSKPKVIRSMNKHKKLPIGLNSIGSFFISFSPEKKQIFFFFFFIFRRRSFFIYFFVC